jgi:hypothetical protein
MEPALLGCSRSACLLERLDDEKELQQEFMLE